MDTIVTLEDVGDFVRSEPFAVICMDMENQGSDMLVLPDARSGLRREMLVIRASVDPQDPAEGLDAVLEAELVDGV